MHLWLSAMLGRAPRIHGHLIQMQVRQNICFWTQAYRNRIWLYVLILPFFDVIERGGVPPSMFLDVNFQHQIRLCYADPRIWKGIHVIMHETQLNRWASRKSLIRRIQGEPLLRSSQKPWVFLWEQSDICPTCHMDFRTNQPLFRCFDVMVSFIMVV